MAYYIQQAGPHGASGKSGRHDAALAGAARDGERAVTGACGTVARSTIRALPFDGQSRMVSAEPGAGARARDAAHGSALALLAWSLTYLARQAGFGSGPVLGLFGDFAIEGAALALAWLGALVAACLAVHAGAIVLHDPAGKSRA